ncbi:MAG: GIY-YIG nuclease family protein, partial [Gemmataceae bacterium]
ILILGAAIGMCLLFYLMMDGVRKEYMSKKAELNEELERFDSKHRRLNNSLVQLGDDRASLSQDCARLDRELAAFSHLQQSFHEERTRFYNQKKLFTNQFVTYSDLQSENQLLKDELRTITSQVAFIEYINAELKDPREQLRRDRDQVNSQIAKHSEDMIQFSLLQKEYLRDREVLQSQREALSRKKIQLQDLQEENEVLKTEIIKSTLFDASRNYTDIESKRQAIRLQHSLNTIGTLTWDETINALVRSIKMDNYPNQKAKLEQRHHKLVSVGVHLPVSMLNDGIVLLQAAYKKAVRVFEERERQLELKEQLRDVERQEREREAADEEVARAAKEQEAIETALAEALARQSDSHTAELDAQAAEIEKLQLQLKEAEANSARAVALAQLTRVGHVYVISNIGSFGEGIYKIGMTRRSDPQDRVDELGDASVPFPFDVHMMINTEDAPRLEKLLHQQFHNRRVNRMNPRKEFFRVTFEEILETVRENHGEVEYVADSEALQFIQSQRMSEEDDAVIADAFEA